VDLLEVVNWLTGDFRAKLVRCTGSSLEKQKFRRLFLQSVCRINRDLAGNWCTLKKPKFGIRVPVASIAANLCLPKSPVNP
jgi:hypothetical protein